MTSARYVSVVMTMGEEPLTYREAGVDERSEERALSLLLRHLAGTLSSLPEEDILVPFGYFAAVVRVREDLALAVSADGVGTKVLIAQMLSRYDTIGIDGIAMNVNDVLCVGARPFLFLDYLAVEEVRPEVVEAIGRGLADGARQAGVAIVGGELAQVRDLIKGHRSGVGFDLVGFCVGLVSPDKVITGQDLQIGDVLIGLPSSGIHSNGLTLARKVLFDRARLKPDQFIPELATTVGEELLKPTTIYVSPVLSLMEKVAVTGLFHITGGGLKNLLRTAKPASFVLDRWTEVPPIFSLIQHYGSVPEEEMWTTFNMGIGFCVLVRETDATKALEHLKEAGALPIGQVRALGERKVSLTWNGLTVG
ncbi:MAG: phosphoribosylformylglycinamidine cyclo-ligase [Armatimonadetes bacterium]|nr:phosphoribosylformylglycinamidine cyclo-ligase [Armatimonadota bacterium]MDW8121062.1 phosphoribosylformylglycinamidine cyclo-ligase [Armatimonadota bacterium]